MSEFAVDPVIASLTHTVADWPLSRLFVFNDSRYQWGLLVPRRAGIVEICDLNDADQQQLLAEIVRLSRIVRALPGVTKINVGNLGNVVTQLHVHVIGRHEGDPAWPGPVWQHSKAVPWADPAKAPLALADTAWT